MSHRRAEKLSQFFFLRLFFFYFFLFYFVDVRNGLQDPTLKSSVHLHLHCVNSSGVHFIDAPNRRWAVGSGGTPTVNRNTSRKFAAVFVAAHR